MRFQLKFHTQLEFWAVVSVIAEAHIADLRYRQTIIDMTHAAIARLAADDTPVPSPSVATEEDPAQTPIA